MVKVSRVRALWFTVVCYVVPVYVFAAGPLQHCRQLYAAPDSQAAFQQCLPLAQGGSGEASYILSELYTRGLGADKPDLQQALIWLIQAANQGHTAASYNLATLYEHGGIVDRSSILAYAWYRYGAERGHAASQLKLGTMLLKGVGTAKDPTQGLAWLRKAAESGDQGAQLTLATVLRNVDAGQSVAWYARAADQGNSLAYYQLAKAHADGTLEQPQDLEKALYLAQKSVILGRAGSQELVDTLRARLIASRNTPASATAPEAVAADAAPAAPARVAKPLTALAAHDPAATARDRAAPQKIAAAPPASARRENTDVPPASGKAVALSRQGPAAAPEARAVPQASAPFAVSPESAPGPGAKAGVASGVGHQDKAWLMAQSAPHYVLQLAQLSSEESVQRFLTKMGLAGRANYYYAHTNAGRVFVVLYAHSYASLQAAQAGVRESLPAALQEAVWYRRFESLQADYRTP